MSDQLKNLCCFRYEALHCTENNIVKTSEDFESVAEPRFNLIFGQDDWDWIGVVSQQHIHRLLRRTIPGWIVTQF